MMLKQYNGLTDTVFPTYVSKILNLLKPVPQHFTHTKSNKQKTFNFNKERNQNKNHLFYLKKYNL